MNANIVVNPLQKKIRIEDELQNKGEKNDILLKQQPQYEFNSSNEILTMLKYEEYEPIETLLNKYFHDKMKDALYVTNFKLVLKNMNTRDMNEPEKILVKYNEFLNNDVCINIKNNNLFFYNKFIIRDISNLIFIHHYLLRPLSSYELHTQEKDIELQQNLIDNFEHFTFIYNNLMVIIKKIIDINFYVKILDAIYNFDVIISFLNFIYKSGKNRVEITKEITGRNIVLGGGSIDLYRRKAYKYKSKYLELKKQLH